MHEKKQVVILGGGTAGWITANLMAVHMRDKGYEITLVESPNIGIIGVGEGSTPPLKGFMDTIGVKEHEWMPKCNATYKVGITFKEWSTKPGFTEYVHPFLCQPDQFTAPAFFHNSYLIRKGVDLEGHPNNFFLTTEMINQKLAPIAPENFPFEINYGYHFDSALLGKFLAEHAKKQGVLYKSATVTEVNLANDGSIYCLKTGEGEMIKGDLYVDSSGFKAELIQQVLKVPFISYEKSLFNDSAVVLPSKIEENITPHTMSTALKHGWAWRIPLQNRVGNGYVYSSKFVDSHEAEQELRQHIGQIDENVQARHLKFKVGRVERHWEKNCLAVGLSQGFVEPLEATALDMVQETVVRFIEAYLATGSEDKRRSDFNDRISARFDAIKDYIVCHYRINTRSDTEYWRANAQNEDISMSLRRILMSWMQGQNITDELQKQKLDAYFPNVSWNCLLAGKGLYPSKEQLRENQEYAQQYKLQDIRKFIMGCSLNFKPHMEQLARLEQASQI